MNNSFHKLSDYSFLLDPFLFGVIGSILLGSYIGWQALRDNPNYQFIRNCGVFFLHWPSWFGTTFQGADLERAEFSFATLKNADFTKANLKHARWFSARRLEYSRFGKSYLRYPIIRKLLSSELSSSPTQSKRKRFVRYICQRLPRRLQKLINLFAQKIPKTDFVRYIYRRLPKRLRELIHLFAQKTPRNFDCLDLRGICLSYWQEQQTQQPINGKPFDLAGASFVGADLSDANLRGANLYKAKLVCAKLDGTDLRNTNLTGICIQDWQVTPTTCFEGACCKYLDLRKATPGNLDPVRREFDKGTQLNLNMFRELLIPAAEQELIDKLYKEFAAIDLIDNKVIREYRLTQEANRSLESYGIDATRYRQMFEDYQKQKLQSERQHSWWQSIIWFKIEPWIEKVNLWTKELDIFPLLENLGRLSILVAVITFLNSVLKPPEENLEKQYRPWELILSDTQEVRGISRFALEQLRAQGTSLVGLKAIGVNLSRINLGGANLTDVDLSKATLQEADLRGAILVRAKLVDANLSKAKLGYSGALDDEEEKTEPLKWLPELLPDVMKKGANLKEADLSKANLTQADLKHVDLENAKLNKANLTQADLLNAKNLNKVELNKAFYLSNRPPKLPEEFKLKNLKILKVGPGENLSGVDLSGVDLSGADLSGADLSGADLSNTNLSKTKLAGTILKNTKNLQQANLTSALYSKQTVFPQGFDPKKVGMKENSTVE